MTENERGAKLSLIELKDSKELEEWRREALYDETGLRNKKWWSFYSEIAFRELKSSGIIFSVAWFDLNSLGLLNDMIGELEVDKLLADIGAIFTKPDVGFRKEDVSVHLHGDTYVVILQAGSRAASEIVFRPCKEIENLEHKYILPPSFSIGIASLENYNFSNMEEMLHAAQIACTHAKLPRTGGISPSVVIYTPGMQRVEHKK